MSCAREQVVDRYGDRLGAEAREPGPEDAEANETRNCSVGAEADEARDWPVGAAAVAAYRNGGDIAPVLSQRVPFAYAELPPDGPSEHGGWAAVPARTSTMVHRPDQQGRQTTEEPRKRDECLTGGGQVVCQ